MAGPQLSEIAAILAMGVLRLHKRRLLAEPRPGAASNTSAESSSGRLESSDETVLSVVSG
jgi:hypothetical protein